MRGWTFCTIGDLGRVVTGKTPPTSRPDLFDGEYPFITPGDLDFESRTPTAERSISELGSYHLATTALPEASTVFVCIGGTIGKMGLTDQRSFSNQQVNSVVPDRSRHDPRFVYYLLRTVRPQVQSLATGTYTKIVNKTVFSGVRVSVPRLDVQRRIADILSAYDDLIENNNRRIALLEESIHLLYREWFVYLRFPGHERVEVVDGVPEGWGLKPLSEVAGVNAESLSPKRAPSQIRYIAIRDVSTGQIDAYTDQPFSDAPSRARRVVRDGDIIWATVRPGNRAYAVIKSPVENLIVSTGFAVLRPTSVGTAFLYTATTRNEFVNHMKAIAQGAAYPALKARDFKEYRQLVPAKALLAEFEENAGPVLDAIHTLRQQNEKLREARDLLLPRLMDGRIPV